MDIEKISRERVGFSNIKKGECFMSDGDVFMKASYGTETVIVNLEKGIVYTAENMGLFQR